MLKKLYPSDFISLSFDKAKQTFPFESNTKLAIEKMGQEIVKLKDNSICFGWFRRGKIRHIAYVSFFEKQLIVHYSINLQPAEEFGNYHKKILYLAKSYRMNEIVIKISNHFLEVDKELKKQDYAYVVNIGYVFKVVYNTGLVLGGGGAKGAYQIGVWRALEELDVEYNMISGTSVGALNGSLMLQGNLEVAENMWQKISTNKILDLPEPEQKNDYSVDQLIQNWHRLTKSALQSKGVSTKPLLDLIKNMMVAEEIFSRKIDFYLVATMTPGMTERVVSLKDMTEENLPLWLLASSSFYPAMAPCLIDGTYYIDGGYRNNIPKDVLVNQGATDIIVVDVSGPGLSKNYKVPENVVEVNLKSSWKLGSMLLFDGNRATWNMILGYLETMKLYREFEGNDYTFEKDNFDQNILKLSREFFRFLDSIPKFKEWYDKKTTLKMWDWLQKNNQRPETVSLMFLESIGKKLNILPIEVYKINDFIETIKNKWHREDSVEEYLSENMLKSISEWLASYLKQKSPIADYQVLGYYYSYFSQDSEKGKEIFPMLMEVSWLNGLEALFLLFLEKRKI